MRLFDEQGIEKSVEISLKMLVSTFIDIAEELVEKDLAETQDRETTLTAPAIPIVVRSRTP